MRGLFENLPVWCPIMGNHIRRLGIIRVAIGAAGIYCAVPLFLVLHVVVVGLLVQRIIIPMTGMKRVDSKKYIILDRYRVEGLARIDKLHCLFCGWANGICTLLHDLTDAIARNPIKLTLFKRITVILCCVLFIPPALIIQVTFFFIYNYIIAAPLRLEKVYYGDLIKKYLGQTGYAVRHKPWARLFLGYQKIIWTGLGLALRYIESAWCPIRHFERSEGTVYPDHHQLFFEPHQIDQLREYLKDHPDVSKR